MSTDLISMTPSILFIVQGVVVTLKYSVTAVFFGSILGAFLALSKISNNFYLKYFAEIYTSIFRGTPVLIQLSIIYFCLPAIGLNVTVFTAGALAFSLNSGAYVSEIIRAGMSSVDRGQYEAAKILGIRTTFTIRDIILPQAIRNILPSLINELISLIKETAVISIIGEMDLMRRAQVVSAETYSFFLPMCTAAVSYYILILFVSFLGRILEKRLAK